MMTLNYVLSSPLCLSPTMYQPNFIGSSATKFNPLQGNSIELAIAWTDLFRSNQKTWTGEAPKGPNFCAQIG